MENKKSKVYEFVKEFFRPTKGKIIIFFLLILTVLFLYVGYVLLIFDCFEGPCPKSVVDTILLKIYDILTIILSLNILTKLFQNFTIGTKIFIAIILEITYLYILSCLIVNFFTKLRNFVKNVKTK